MIDRIKFPGKIIERVTPVSGDCDEKKSNKKTSSQEDEEEIFKDIRA